MNIICQTGFMVGIAPQGRRGDDGHTMAGIWTSTLNAAEPRIVVLCCTLLYIIRCSDAESLLRLYNIYHPKWIPRDILAWIKIPNACGTSLRFVDLIPTCNQA